MQAKYLQAGLDLYGPTVKAGLGAGLVGINALRTLYNNKYSTPTSLGTNNIAALSSRVPSSMRFKKRRFPKKRAIRVPYIVKPEIKSVDINNTTTSVTTGAPNVLLPLNLVAQGQSYYNRIGSRVRGVSVECWGRVRNLSTTTTVPFRILCVWDKDPNGAPPSASAILLDTDAAGTTATSAMSGRSPATTLRFKTLFDRYFVLQENVTANVASCFDFNFWRKVNLISSQYSGTTATMASLSSGGIYLVLVGDITDVVNGVSVLWSSRYRYTDA